MKSKKNIFIVLFFLLFLSKTSIIDARQVQGTDIGGGSKTNYLISTCEYRNNKNETIVVTRELHKQKPNLDRYLTTKQSVNGKKVNFSADDNSYYYLSDCPQSVNKKAKKISSSKDKYDYKLVKTNYSKPLKSNKCYYKNDSGTSIEFVSGIKPYTSGKQTTYRYEYSVKLLTSNMGKQEDYYPTSIDFWDYYERFSTGGCYKTALYNPSGDGFLGLGASGLQFSDASTPAAPSGWKTYETLTFTADENAMKENNNNLKNTMDDATKAVEDYQKEQQKLEEMKADEASYTEEQIEEQENRVDQLRTESEDLSSAALLTCKEYRDSAVISQEMEEKCANFRQQVSSWVEAGVISDFHSGCAMLGSLNEWLQAFFNFIKILAIVLLIVLGILDFVKALLSGKDDSLKGAWNDFIKRSIALVFLFLLPFILEFLLSELGVFDNNPSMSQEESRLCDIE